MKIESYDVFSGTTLIRQQVAVGYTLIAHILSYSASAEAELHNY